MVKRANHPYLLFFCFALTAGCAREPFSNTHAAKSQADSQTSPAEPSQLNQSSPKILPDSVEAAEAEAIIETIHRTSPYTNAQQQVGAVFCQNMPEPVVAALRMHSRSSLPRVDSDLLHFDASTFRDNLSGKPALVIRCHVLAEDRQKPVFDVMNMYGSVGASECKVILEWRTDRWYVVSFLIIGAG